MRPGLHTIPAEIDDLVARAKLASLGVEPEKLTEEQISYQKSWRWEPSVDEKPKADG
jgi:adenosylhomocysteinase